MTVCGGLRPTEGAHGTAEAVRRVPLVAERTAPVPLSFGEAAQ